MAQRRGLAGGTQDATELGDGQGRLGEIAGDTVLVQKGAVGEHGGWERRGRFFDHGSA